MVALDILSDGFFAAVAGSELFPTHLCAHLK